MVQYLDKSGLETLITKIKGKFATIEKVTDLEGLIRDAADALVFKGTIGVNGTISTLPNPHNAGWTYKVSDNETTLNGVKCELGDLIICVTSGETANASHWTIVQSNIDGAVTSTANVSQNNHIPVFDGTTGRIIKSPASDSMVTLDASLMIEKNLDISGNVDIYTNLIVEGNTTMEQLQCDGEVALNGPSTIQYDYDNDCNDYSIANTKFVHSILEEKISTITEEEIKTIFN